MKKFLKTNWAVAGLLAIFSLSLFSFISPTGGEGFEIYLNNKLVLQKFGNEMDKVQSISLDENSLNGELSVKYHHCGKVGKNRVLTIKDSDNKILKEWKFADVSEASASMKCGVKEIFSLQIKNNTKLNLYYTSSELPKGRMLATITATAGSKISEP
jgi:hypothetical protein